MKKDLSLEPYNISETVWLYEEMNGITVVHEIRVNGEYRRTDQFNIPLRKIRSYLKRRDKK